jgi:hypothetical protein
VDKYAWSNADYDCSIEERISLSVPTKWLVNSMKLRWAGQEGSFLDAQGRLTVCCPSLSEPGPQVLLVNQEPFGRFLAESAYAVVWLAVGEKNILGQEVGTEGHLGLLKYSGAWQLSGGQVVGGIRSSFCE